MIHEINKSELKKKLESKKPPVVVEVAETKDFQELHIKGARNIPLNEKFETEFQRMIPDKSSPVVVYSTNTASDAAPKAAKRLERAGYKAVYDYRGGKEEWKSAGYPVETGAH